MPHGARLDRLASHQRRQDIHPLRTIRLDLAVRFQHFGEKSCQSFTRCIAPQACKIAPLVDGDGLKHPTRAFCPFAERQLLRQNASVARPDQGRDKRLDGRGDALRECPCEFDLFRADRDTPLRLVPICEMRIQPFGEKRLHISEIETFETAT